ncbi:alpha/beta fold hydrolase [Paenibacillus alkalitolerans]|uniref:alpha/beta fold hydrolase n=1 Tax=Paenibacillus alkalitolerans TaxID=2799335 RepID=UPI0018F3A65C|nr:alpha/beta hydrolase [Paenibacillus alkalitolerans]
MPKALINGTTIHYHVHGKGTPIVFIHPPLVNSAVFRYQEVQLADPFQVVTFDIRGHGFSPRSEAPVTYPLIVEDIVRLMDHIGLEQAYLCGYSTGGGIAFEALLTYPERFRGAVCLGAMPEVGDLCLKAQLAAASVLTRLGMKTSMALLISAGNADMKETFHNLYYEAIRGDIENWRQYFEASMKYNCTDRLKRIHAPVLLIYGMNDSRFKKYGQQLHELLPQSTLAFVPGVRHTIPTKKPEPMHDLLSKWIMEHELRAAEEGEAGVGRDLLRKAAEYGIRLPGEVDEQFAER